MSEVGNDFGFYGEENDETSVQDIKGITDHVSEFVYTNLTYPCIIFKKNFHCPKHQMKVLSNMVKSKGITKDITLYFEKGIDDSASELFKIGTIGGVQVDSLLSIFSSENLLGFYDSDTVLEGSKLYTLCTI